MNAPESYENGYALLIGIRYGHWLDHLEGPLNDVKALKEHFVDPFKAAYNTNNIIELKEKDATASGILNALDDVAKMVATNPDATVIIYYSGHGGNFNNKYFLVPYDFNRNEWSTGGLDESSIVQTSEFAEKINNIKAKKCLIMLDCCHAENIPVEKKLINSKTFMGDFAEVLNSEIIDVPVQKDLNSKLNKGMGRVILTSCEADETSLDLGSISLFTKVLLESFNGHGNIEQDGWVRLIDLMRYVPKNVAEEAKKFDNHDQHPMFKRIENLSSEDFIICAYDLQKAKGVKTSAQDVKPSQQIPIDSLEKLIDEANYPDAFKKIDNMNIPNQIQYNRFKREFSAGIKGIDLIDFADRLKVFINHQL